MIIFHGSDTAVKEPKIIPANRLLDFGEGFYTTSSHEQAQRWAGRVRMNRKTKDQIISVYEFDLEKAAKNLTIIRFDCMRRVHTAGMYPETNTLPKQQPAHQGEVVDTPDYEWLRFVTVCRSGKETDFMYDMAIGPVANDNVYATIQLYETGLLSESETIIRLKVEKIFDQILFHTEQSLRYCNYLRHENVNEAMNG